MKKKKKYKSRRTDEKKDWKTWFAIFGYRLTVLCFTSWPHNQCDCHSIKPLICTTNLNTALIVVVFPSRNTYESYRDASYLLYADNMINVLHHTVWITVFTSNYNRSTISYLKWHLKKKKKKKLLKLSLNWLHDNDALNTGFK